MSLFPAYELLGAATVTVGDAEAGRAQTTPPPLTIAPSPRTPAEIEQITAICAACQWNVDELCQHSGCKVCPGKQRNSGGLQRMIADPRSKCAAGKW